MAENDMLASALARAQAMSDLPLMTQVLANYKRCPHCRRADPTVVRQWMSTIEGLARGDGGQQSIWAAYSCQSCGGLITAQGVPGMLRGQTEPRIIRFIPESRIASDQLPQAARRYLQQAIDTIHAPDAAAVMAGSAVDAMLKELGYAQGSLYSRIDKALEDHVITKGMSEWAHSVRLESNRPRHADKDTPHVSPEDATRAVEFAEALGNFLFVLTAQIAKAVGNVSGGDDELKPAVSA